MEAEEERLRKTLETAVKENLELVTAFKSDINEMTVRLNRIIIGMAILILAVFFMALRIYFG